MKRRLLFTLLCSLAWVFAQETPVSVERLAELLLGEGEAVTFLPEQLPDSLNLPLPAEARVLGSATIGEDRAVAALEVQGNREASLQRFEDAFLAAGWRGYDPFAGPKVFQASGNEREPLTDFCSPDRSSEVYFETDTLAEGALLVLVNVNPYCNDAEGISLPLPSLTFPAGVLSYGGGLSQSGTSFQANASFGTRLSAAELFGHFAEQLKAQGWRVAEKEQTEEVEPEVALTDEEGNPVPLTAARQAEVTLEAESGRWQGLLTVTGAQAVLQVSRLP